MNLGLLLLAYLIIFLIFFLIGRLILGRFIFPGRKESK